MIVENRLDSNRLISARVVFCLFLIYALSSCSFHKKPEPAVEPILDFPLIQESDASIEGEINRFMTRGEDRVYFSSSRGCLYCIDDPKQGTQRLFSSKSDFVSPPYVNGEYIFIYDSRNNIFCIHNNGTLAWKVGIEENISGDIAVSSGKIFFGTENGRFLCLDADSGEFLWEVKAEGPIYSRPAVINDMIVFGCDDKRLYFLNFDGGIIKKHETGGKIRGAFAYRQDRLYFGSYDGYFYCINVNKQKIEWKVKTGGKVQAFPLLYEKCVLFASWENVLYCLNAKNGTVLWWSQIPGRCLFPLEAVGTRLFVTSFSLKMKRFDIKTGEDKGEYAVKNEMSSNPLWFRETLLLFVYDKEEDMSKILFLIINKKLIEKK